MKHKQWFELLTNRASGLEASKKANVPTSTLNRQLLKGVLTPDVVIALARAYGQNPVEALGATGFLTLEEIAGVSAEVAAEILSDQQMIRSLAKRIDSNPEAWYGTFGEFADDESISVVEMHARSNSPESVRRERYVALEAEAEPEMGDDDYGPGA